MNKTKIKITHIANHGKSHEIYCDRILMLRHARHEGDEEVVNNFVLGRLREKVGFDFGFEEIEKL